MPCQRYYCKELSETKPFFQILAKREEVNPEIEEKVKSIIANVREQGDVALLSYTQEYDCPTFNSSFLVSPLDIAQAAGSISPEEFSIIQTAAGNIRQFHEAQKEKSWFQTKTDGSILGQKVEPINRAGIYVPAGKGGNTPLISSLLMGAIPAIVAGVSEIAVVSPPREDGTLNPYILAAAYLLDISEVYAVGGAWSIAALAYGTQSINPVDIIAGPGNAYVTTAKRLVQGHVGIDMVAGPSEILVLADEFANADYIAADMLSQAEHDALASAVLVTDSSVVADRVLQCLETRIHSLPREAIARQALADWSAIVVLPSISACVDFANQVAPEHLEVLTRDPWQVLPHIKNAGAVFMGTYSPEAVGDYFAGPNHVLPTLGTARFASALSVQTFTKRINIIAASQSFTQKHAEDIAHLARLEGLEAHARSVEARKR